jgi:hypothetical protein
MGQEPRLGKAAFLGGRAQLSLHQRRCPFEPAAAALSGPAVIVGAAMSACS